MSKRPAMVLLALLLCSLAGPMVVSAEQSGSIEASASTVTLQPSTPSAGDDLAITVAFLNTASQSAYTVEYFVYKDTVNADRLLEQGIINEIEAEGLTSKTVYWNGLTEGQHRVWVAFEHDGDIRQTFSVPFEVSGLPDLRVTGAEVVDASSLKTGDDATVEVDISNIGSEPAAASVLGVALSGVALDSLAVAALDAGASTTLTVNFTAPPTGEYVLRLTPDAEDAVVESQEENQDYDLAFTVHPRMDVRHKGAPTVTVVEGALNGPWTVSGEIERFDGDGTIEVPMRLEVPNDNGGTLMLGSFSVTVAGQGYASTIWQTTIDSDDVVGLQRISREVVAVIDPFGTASFVQESTTNDRSPAGNLDLLPIPDVQLDPPIPNPSEPESGEAVSWSVFIQNVGEIPVRGTLEYSFEGIEYEDRIFLDAAEGKFWSPENPLPTALGEHTAEFTARYVPDADSWDYNPDNSRATVSVEVQAPLRLEWNTPTLELVDVNQAPAEAPLTPGQTYTMAIGVTSVETGPVNYTCDDGAGNVFEVIPVVIETRGQRATVSCTFEAQTGQTAVRLVPDDVDVSSVFMRAYASAAVQDDSITDEQRSLRGLLSWAGLLVLVLIGVLVLGVIITRDRDEEVERDIFEYCPSCDGELEGDENKCPHCNFNLAKARLQFHECNACGESIPDLMENCAYCGAPQDVASFFEQRKRIERKAEVEVPLPVEEDDDDDKIVSGTEDFAATVQAFGYDEDDLEEDWDENMDLAEAEVTEAQDRLDAMDVELDAMTEEELEAWENSVTPTLQSTKDAFGGQDIDDIIAAKGDVQALKDDGSELSASDAGIRERLYELTGEEGVLPGEKVRVDIGLTDSGLAGNEIEEATADFSFEDSEPLPSGAAAAVQPDDELTPKRAKPKRRRSPTRRRASEAEAAPATAECGACGAEIPADATSCSVCGATFE
ncbi:MAG: hypothetical protein CMA56_02190 [Euryarchaeota archaeon]|nr:hypothetical protein [Euryarchaeota archaeon]